MISVGYIIKFDNSLNDNNQDIYNIFSDIVNRIENIKIDCDPDYDDTIDYYKRIILKIINYYYDKCISKFLDITINI